MVEFSSKYILFFFSTLTFGFLINFIFLRFVRTLGIRNMEDTVIRWNKTSKPSIGGLSFYIIFLLSISAYAIGFKNDQGILSLREVGVLMSCSLGFLMGLADDAYNTRPILKSATQVLCAGLLIATGTYIELFDSLWINYLLTVIWVTGMMNSINMLDNMDGITSIVSLVISVSILICLWTSDNTESMYFIVISGLIAALIAFLFYNWYPSKMFMGDSGSQFLGSLLAAFGIIFLWNLEPLDQSEPFIFKKILFPILAFIVPIADTTTVVINRIAKGTSPFVGGKDHTTHHLARLGLSETQVALAVMILSSLSGLLIIVYYNDQNRFNTLELLSMSVYAIGVIVGLFSVTKLSKDII